MQSVLPRVGHGLDQRALIYDAKQDIHSLLGGLGLHCPIATFHPLDARCVAWDMAADITSATAALQAATLLVPKAQQDVNPLFSNAARHLMSAALLALILQAPGRSTLRHLLLVLRSEALLRQVLAQTECTRPLLQCGEHAATFQNILSTLLTRIAPFEIIAAAWDGAEHKLSLRAWLEQEAILILANDEDNRAAIDTINQLLFKRLSELVLARDELPEDSQRTTWFFLDEVRQAGRLDGLSALMTKGRSKGAAVLRARPRTELFAEWQFRHGPWRFLNKCWNLPDAPRPTPDAYWPLSFDHWRYPSGSWPSPGEHRRHRDGHWLSRFDQRRCPGGRPHLPDAHWQPHCADPRVLPPTAIHVQTLRFSGRLALGLQIIHRRRRGASAGSPRRRWNNSGNRIRN